MIWTCFQVSNSKHTNCFRFKSNWIDKLTIVDTTKAIKILINVINYGNYNDSWNLNVDETLSLSLSLFSRNCFLNLFVTILLRKKVSLACSIWLATYWTFTDKTFTKWTYSNDSQSWVIAIYFFKQVIINFIM